MRFLYLLALIPFAANAQTALSPLGQISSSGNYYLTGNSTSTGVINLRIDADNVDLDLNGKTVRCNPSDPSTTVNFGVYALSRNNVTIRNGKITGCFFGVHASYSNNVTLENIDFSGNTYVGANLCGGGSGCVVRGSTFDNITGYDLEGYAIGVNGLGSNCTVENNVFSNLYEQPGYTGPDAAEGVGVLISAGSTGCRISGNVFRNDTETTHTYAMWMATTPSGTHTVTDNLVMGFQYGIAASGETTATASDNAFWIRSQIPGSVAITSDGGSMDDNIVCHYATVTSGSITETATQLCPAMM